jgi:cysteine-rich repeat protein
VRWRSGAAPPAAFALAGGGATWTGEFPAQPAGTVIAYTVDAALDDGTHVVLPYNPADPEYQMFVGPAVTIACASMERDPRWAQTGTFGGEWQWGPLHATAPTRDPSTAHSGASVLGTNLGGDGSYRANDTTALAMPASDVAGFGSVHLQFWRWLTVEDSTYDRAEISANGHTIWRNAASRTGTLDHVDREWRFADVDVTAYAAAGTPQITWSLASDDSKQLGGWTLDDVCLVGLGKPASCGNGVVDTGEQCDDGNTANGDGCDAECRFEISAGGGGCAAGGGGGTNPTMAVLVLAALYFARRRCSSRAPSRSVSERMP